MKVDPKTLKPSAKCGALIESFEGRKHKAYICPAGKWTIGVGHTGPEVKAGLIWTDAQCSAQLVLDMAKFAKAVRAMVEVPITQGMFDGLVAFAFNTGAANLQNSTLMKKLNAGDYAGAAAQFDRWVYARDPKTGRMVVLRGLVTRRAAEKALFLS